MSEADLKKLRGEIDALDAKVLDLLNRRAAVVHKVGVVKGGKGVRRSKSFRNG